MAAVLVAPHGLIAVVPAWASFAAAFAQVKRIVRKCVRDVARPSARGASACPQERQPRVAEAVARDLPRPLPLEDALRLVYLYAEKESPKFERAAMRWLQRYLEESSPRLKEVVKVATALCECRGQKLIVRCRLTD
jgi:hypothetical protein